MDVWWDVEGYAPGTYLLRAEMHQQFGGWGFVEQEIEVASAPRGEVKVVDLATGHVTLTAADVVDAYDPELGHAWRFGNGQTFETAQVNVTYEVLPIVFTHTASNLSAVTLSNTYILMPGILLSLNDAAIKAALALWEREVRDVIDEKTQLRPRLNGANQTLLDDALARLREAADKLKEVRDKLNATPPDEAGRRRPATCRELLDEAIRLFQQITELRSEMDANQARVSGLWDRLGVTALENAALVDGINELVAIIQEKKAVPALGAPRQAELDAAIRLLEEAKALLDQAKEHLLETPPDLAAARTKIAAARAKLKEAAEKIDGLAPAPPWAAANVERIKVLSLELGFLEGKLWLLEQIGLRDPHVDIPLPDLTRDEFPVYRHNAGNGDVQMGRPPGSPMDDNAFDDAVLFHELDHHILWQKNRVVLGGGRHWYDEDLSESRPNPGDPKRGEQEGQEVAWAEGWANFSSCAKRKDPTYLDTGEDVQPAGAHFTIEKDLENDRCRNTGEAAMHPSGSRGRTSKALSPASCGICSTAPTPARRIATAMAFRSSSAGSGRRSISCPRRGTSTTSARTWRRCYRLTASPTMAPSWRTSSATTVSSRHGTLARRATAKPLVLFPYRT